MMKRRRALLFTLLLLVGCKDDNKQYNGYIDADLTYLSSNYPGQLQNLFVHRGDAINRGDLLFKVEQTGEQFNIDQSKLAEQNAKAQRQSILDQIHYEQTNLRRNQAMKTRQAASQHEVDQSQKNVDVLKNQLLEMDDQIQSRHVATLDKIWQKSRKESRAADDGLIFDTYFTAHEYVQAGQPVLSVITKDNIKVIFYVSEPDLSQITLGSKVSLSVDGNPHFAVGHIRYISNIAQYTPPIIYSREERQNLLFRVEASLDSPSLNNIHLGQPVSLVIHR